MLTDTITVLLVDDDPGDVDLTRDVLEEAKVALNLQTAHDGVEALAYLRREGRYTAAGRPDLILLDLNMPKKDGREVLAELKRDPTLHAIPVVVLTTSDDEADIYKVYELGASCYITKPVGLEQFAQVIRRIEDFWFTIVKLPPEVRR